MYISFFMNWKGCGDNMKIEISVPEMIDLWCLIKEHEREYPGLLMTNINISRVYARFDRRLKKYFADEGKKEE